MLQDAEFLRKSIRYLDRYFEKSIQKKVEQSGFTIPQMRVIKEVVAHEGISIKQISLNLPMTQSTVSGIVERLVNKGILMRKSNSRDKRAVQIFSTDAVAQFIEKDRMEYTNQSVMDALSILNPEERAVVMDGVRLLVDAVNAVNTGLKGEQI